MKNQYFALYLTIVLFTPTVCTGDPTLALHQNSANSTRTTVLNKMGTLAKNGLLAYGLTWAHTLIYESGHIAAAWLTNGKYLSIIGGNNTQGLICADLGPFRILGLNPLITASEQQIQYTAHSWATTFATGPLAAIAFTHILGKQLAPSSFLACWNQFLHIGCGMLELLPSENPKPSDGLHICNAVGINYNFMRLAVGTWVAYDMYKFVKKYKQATQKQQASATHPSS